MTILDSLALAIVGLFTGVLAGFLGIGGGTVLVPILVALGARPVEAVATSSLAIIVTSLSGSIQNWRMGLLSFQSVFFLGLPALLTAQFGVLLADELPARVLLVAFGLLLLMNVYLVEWRKHVTRQALRASQAASHTECREVSGTTNAIASSEASATWNPIAARIFTGGISGFMAGLFGIGGGVIMVPLQILLLNETIKTAIQTSLGTIVLTALSSTIGHALKGNVLWMTGLLLGMGGFIGAQISTRLLPRLPDRLVSVLFRALLLLLAAYIFYQAWAY
ncbi:putative permease [Rubidibacter lacunae KORDI 51-2]|uniref:Probable membrane transporter protein n=1 Tax=Rubidibacter lacunae KORDI 51-2 TaxID=582515 RepID=U5DL05_9CHRO|nr:sulfite exporter TauE/SafE family protein [Rubidibacter lacunae]ERN42366.1 putative permease [Rubidibacter lacunae KORDI 51-2]